MVPCMKPTSTRQKLHPKTPLDIHISWQCACRSDPCTSTRQRDAPLYQGSSHASRSYSTMQGKVLQRQCHCETCIQPPIVALYKANLLRRALGQNNLDLSLIHNRSRDMCHDGNTNDVPLIRCIPAHGVLEGGIEPKSKRIVPSTQKRVSGTHFKHTVLNSLATLGHRRGAA